MKHKHALQLSQMAPSVARAMKKKHIIPFLKKNNSRWTLRWALCLQRVALKSLHVAAILKDQSHNKNISVNNLNIEFDGYAFAEPSFFICFYIHYYQQRWGLNFLPLHSTVCPRRSPIQDALGATEDQWQAGTRSIQAVAR